MKYTLLISFLFIGFLGFSQKVKVKIKDNIATIDGVDYISYTKQNMANDASIAELNQPEQIFASFQGYKDPNEITKSNPEGRVRWIEINFLDLKIKCEVQSMTHKGLVKLLYTNKIFVDGKLNEENARRFCAKYGMRFSENRPGGNVNIIINNQ